MVLLHGDFVISPLLHFRVNIIASILGLYVIIVDFFIENIFINVYEQNQPIMELG